MARRKALPTPPTDLWAPAARNGHRYHALETLVPYESETSCGLAVPDVVLTRLTAEMEVDRDADVPCPPKPCPACIKALTLKEKT